MLSFGVFIFDILTDWVVYQVDRKTFDEHAIIESLWLFLTVCGPIVGAIIFVCGFICCCCSDGERSCSSVWSVAEQVLNVILTAVDLSLLGLSLYIGIKFTNLICGDEKEVLDKATFPYVSVSTALVISSVTSFVAIIVRAIKPYARALVLWWNVYGDSRDTAATCCLCCTYAVAFVLALVTTVINIYVVHLHKC